MPLPLSALPSPLAVADPELNETFEALRLLARNKSGASSPEALASHVLSVTQGADFPVRQAAMEALLRRVASAKAGELRVLERPGARRVLGLYRVGRAKGERYATWLTSLDPLAGSCDCRDFARGALGLCKHLLFLRESLASRKRPDRSRPPEAPHQLRWDPVRPLRGPGDWLERVRWQGTAAGRVSRRVAEARRRFDPAGALLSAHPDHPARRAELVETLLWLARAAPLGEAVDPALLPLLERERALLEQSLSSQWSKQELRAHLRSLKRKPYPYQLEGVRRFLEAGRLLLADDMGLGKTAQAITASHLLFTSRSVKRGLILVPAALKVQWLREWQSFTDVPIALVEGGPEQRAATYAECRQGFLIANYEQVLRDLPRMHAWAPELVVLDEAQRIKNWAAKTSAYVKRLSPKWRLVLTGTPLENRVDELASLMDWVDDLALEPKWRLSPWHTTFADGRREVRGARNLDTLRERLAGSMVRRVRQEVLAQLPSRTDTVIPVPLTEEQWSRHEEYAQPIAALMRRAQVRPLTQVEFLKLMSLLNSQRVLCNGLAQADFEQVWPALRGTARPNEALLKGLGSPKLLELRELIANVAVAQGQKVVVFSQWKRMLKLARWAVSDLLEDAGVEARFFTGDEGQRRRTQNVIDFHDEPEVRILFASDAGGVGLNLQKAASCCINLELPWNPAVLEQRIGRVYRLGQSRAVQVYNLVSASGIESRIAGLVGAKQALFKGLFDGGSDEVSFDQAGSFLSRIQKVVEPVEVPELPEVESGPDEAPEEVAELPEANAVELGVGAGEDRRRPAAAMVAAEPGAVLEPERVRALFHELEVRRETDGRVSLTAPPEAANTLAALFDGMARMLAEASGAR